MDIEYIDSFLFKRVQITNINYFYFQVTSKNTVFFWTKFLKINIMEFLCIKNDIEN